MSVLTGAGEAFIVRNESPSVVLSRDFDVGMFDNDDVFFWMWGCLITMMFFLGGVGCLIMMIFFLMWDV